MTTAAAARRGPRPADRRSRPSACCKAYGRVDALRGVDLAVPEGTVLGLLGPNGAGTTTAVRILTTLLRPDGGGARVAGCDVAREAAALRARIGLAGQYAAVDALRAFWIGAPAGNSIWRALAWCAGLILVFGALAVDRHRRAALR